MIRDENDGWIEVQHKKRRQSRLISQIGRASANQGGKFKAAEDKKVPLFISNVSPETREEDIITYIKEKTNEVIHLKKINVNTNKNYNAYKLYVSKHKVDVFLSEQLWPEGITFRRFVHFMYQTKPKSSVVRVT